MDTKPNDNPVPPRDKDEMAGGDDSNVDSNANDGQSITVKRVPVTSEETPEESNAEETTPVEAPEEEVAEVPEEPVTTPEPVNSPVSEPSEKPAMAAVGGEKKSKKPLLLALLGLVLLLAIAGGAYYYFFVMNKSTPTNTAADTSPAPTEQMSGAEALVNKLSGVITGDEVDIVETTATSAEDGQGTVLYTTPFYLVGERDYSNYPDASFGLAATGTEEVATTDYQALVEAIETEGLETVEITAESPVVTSEALYASDSVVCYVAQMDKSAEQIGSHMTSVVCSDVSSYAAAAVEIDPLFEAYLTGEGLDPETSGETFLVGEPDISDGTEGHMNAIVDINSAVAYLYKAPDADWTLLVHTQDDLACSLLDNETKEMAFDGVDCVDA